MTRTSMKSHIITTSLAAVAAANIAHGAISVVGSTVLADNVATNTDTITVSGFDLGAGNAIVIAVSSEAGGGAATPSYSVTFDGNNITDNVTAIQGAQGGSVFWWINPTVSTGDVVVSLGSTSRAAVSVMSLADVLGVSDQQPGTSTSGGSPINLNYAGLTGGLVVGAYADNGANTGGIPVISGGNIDTLLQSHANNSSGGSAGLIQSYGNINSSGMFTESFTPSRDNSNRNAAALVAFTAVVPEPSSSLLAISGCSLLFLRRRRHA